MHEIQSWLACFIESACSCINPSLEGGFRSLTSRKSFLHLNASLYWFETCWLLLNIKYEYFSHDLSFLIVSYLLLPRSLEYGGNKVICPRALDANTICLTIKNGRAYKRWTFYLKNWISYGHFSMIGRNLNFSQYWYLKILLNFKDFIPIFGMWSQFPCISSIGSHFIWSLISDTIWNPSHFHYPLSHSLTFVKIG